MTGNIFDDVGPDVFEDRDRLREDHVPDRIPERENELRELRNGLAPVMNGYSPDNIFIVGPHGSGKTVSASWVLKQLRQKIGQNNSYLQFQAILERLFEENLPPEIYEKYTFPIADEEVAEEFVSEHEETVGPIEDDVPHSVVPPAFDNGRAAALAVLSETLPDEEVDLTVKWVNCAGVSSGYQLAIRIANSFRSEANELAQSGYAKQRVYDEMFAEIEAAATSDSDDSVGTVLLVLDEITTVKDLDTLFYKLTRARGKGGDLDEARVGTICLSNNTSFSEQFSTRTKSSLTGEEIKFEAYDPSELNAVLNARADEAFRKEALTSGVIPLCASLASKNGGDARLALQLLLKAGDIAIEENSQKVREEHVREAKHRVEQETVVGAVELYNEHPQVALLGLVRLCEQLDRPPKTPEVRSAYEDLCEHAGSDPNNERQCYNYLQQFEEDNLITSSSPSQNEPDRFTLSYPPDRILSAISDDVLELYGGESEQEKATASSS